MVDAVPLDGCGECVGIGLVHELRRVHADHDELVAPLTFERTQLVDHVQAVDAAEGPEVEEDEAAAQVRETHGRAAGVQPSAPGEFGRADAREDRHASQPRHLVRLDDWRRIRPVRPLGQNVPVLTRKSLLPLLLALCLAMSGCGLLGSSSGSGSTPTPTASAGETADATVAAYLAQWQANWSGAKNTEQLTAITKDAAFTTRLADIGAAMEVTKVTLEPKGPAVCRSTRPVRPTSRSQPHSTESATRPGCRRSS